MFRFERPAQNHVGQCLSQQSPIAGDEPAGFGEPPMGRDEIRPREAVAVEEHDIFAARRADRPIADFAGAEAAMLMPHMRKGYAELRLVLLGQRCGGRSKAVVRYDDLEPGSAVSTVDGAPIW